MTAKSSTDTILCFYRYKNCKTIFSKRVEEIVLNAVSEPVFNVEILADKLCMSKSTLLRSIKKLTGLTAIEYINLIKIYYSIELLEDKSLTIKEVAYSIGFSDPKYFTRRFKKMVGLTPKEYKNVRKDLAELKWNGFIMN